LPADGGDETHRGHPQAAYGGKALAKEVAEGEDMLHDEELLADLIRRAADALNAAETKAYLSFDDDDLATLLAMAKHSGRN
jgi:hypothetical protein